MFLNSKDTSCDIDVLLRVKTVMTDILISSGRFKIVCYQ